MADLVSSLLNSSYSSSGTTLDNIVNNLMTTDKAAITSLETKKSDVKVTLSMFDDLKSKIKALQDAADGIATTDTSSVFNSKSATSSDTSKVTASAGASAANGTYQIEVSHLATVHRMQSDRQASATTALGYTGTISVNGVSITIDSSNNTLQGIRDAINNATYASGKEVVASVVDNRLVLQSKNTGATNTMALSDVSGNVFAGLAIVDGSNNLNTTNQLQAASDASFTVNGIAITRSSNTNIEDVVEGVSLTLTAETTSAVNLTIGNDTTTMQDKIKTFLTALNNLTSYIKTKSAVTETGDNTYTRGALASFTSYTGLRSDLYGVMGGVVNGATGAYSLLSQIGITMDDEMVFSITDTKALTDALSTNSSSVASLFVNASDGGIASKIDSMLTLYTKTDGVMDNDVNGLEAEQDALTEQIKRKQENYDTRKKALQTQYSAVIQMLYEIQQQQTSMNNIMSAIYGMSS
jgi:flagellar hook-associated protein 2